MMALRLNNNNYNNDNNNNGKSNFVGVILGIIACRLSKT